MSAANFRVETFVYPGVFPRGHPRCTQKPTDRLEIVVNKYTPKSNPSPGTGDVTLILLHANGFHEIFSPYFSDVDGRNCMSPFLMLFWRAVELGFAFGRFGLRTLQIKELPESAMKTSSVIWVSPLLLKRSWN